MLNNFFANVEAEYPIETILKSLEDFRDRHINDYLVAEKEYRRQFGERLHKALAAFENGEKVRIPEGLGLEKPKNKSDEYHNLISVFSQMRNNSVKLSMQQANCIFNDEWDWIRVAKAVNSTYSASPWLDDDDADAGVYV